MTRNKDFAAILAALLQVPDPDPDREVIACPDCRTTALVLTPTVTGPLLGIQHDATCPAYAAMSEDERTVINDDGAVVHVIPPEVT